MIERRIRPRGMLDVLREQEGGRGKIQLGDISGSFVSIGRLSPREPGQSSLEQSSGGFNVKDHIFRKPAQERSNRPLVAPENEKIMWQPVLIL